MKHFTLSQKPQRRDDTLTTFHVVASDGSIVGAINVPHAEAADLEAHWRSSVATPPQASAPTKQGSALAEAFKATRRPGALPPDHASKPNPAVDAMVAAAQRNKLSRQAILRGC